MLLYNAPKKSNQGFTLIEMIITVVIIGIIATLAVPNFLGLLNRNRVKDGVSQVEGALKEAQRQAMRKGRICKIRFTSNADGNSIIQTHPEETVGGTTVNYSGCLLSTRELPNSVSLSLLNGSTLQLVDSGNMVNLGFSNKGNPDAQRIMVISHEGTSTKKCVQIAGLLGNMLTGDYNESTKQCNVQ
ncbi:type 4 prepilin-like protein [Chondrocystis sp. NIES-4102]|nr:type 4 prepilin-like protein [Chondrocystis sp. NIES-4102]